MRNPRGWGHKRQATNRGGTAVDFRDTRRAVLMAYSIRDLDDETTRGAIIWRLITTDNLIQDQYGTM